MMNEKRWDSDSNSQILSNLLNTNKILSQLVAKTGANAATQARIASLSGTNATIVKPNPGQLFRFSVYNINTSARYFKFYDSTAAPIVGTSIPIFTLVLPASSQYDRTFDVAVPFLNGISYAITGDIADSDTTAITVNDVHGLMLYV